MNIFPSSIDELKKSLSTKTLTNYLEFWNNDESHLLRFLPESYVNKQLNNYILKRKIEIENKSVLEFGCRDGSSFIAFLKFKPKKLVGMDIDKMALNLSSKIYTDLGFANIEYRLNFIDKPLPIADNEFDIVSCNAILEHIHPKNRGYYIKELQRALKPGGFFIISDTPNKLWIREGHTTGLWFLNFVPFKFKCFLGSKFGNFKRKIKSTDYEEWIYQGIEGVSYYEIYKHFKNSNYSNEHDKYFKYEYKKQIFNERKRNILKKLSRYFLFIYALFIDKIYLSPKKFPSLAIQPSLIFSFKKLN